MRFLKKVAVTLITVFQTTFLYRFKRVGRAPRFGSSLFVLRDSVILGDHCYIGKHSYLDADMVVGNFVMIASAVAFVGGDHLTDVPGVPMRFTGRGSTRPIVIEDDVWIGHGAIILHGVTIGEGAIVGAGSIVTHDVPKYSIVIGSPARMLRMRFDPESQRKHEHTLARYRAGEASALSQWAQN